MSVLSAEDAGLEFCLVGAFPRDVAELPAVVAFYSDVAFFPVPLALLVHLRVKGFVLRAVVVFVITFSAAFLLLLCRLLLRIRLEVI